MKKYVNKIGVFFVVISMLLMLFVSSFYIIKHIRHHCTGKECNVCKELIQCSDNIRSPGTAGNTFDELTAFVTGFAVVLVFAAETVSNNNTLISLKVELLN